MRFDNVMSIYVAYAIVVIVIASIIAVAARISVKRGYAFGGVVPQKYVQPAQCTCAAKLPDPFCSQHRQES